MDLGMLGMVTGTACHTAAVVSVLLPYMHFFAGDQVSVLWGNQAMPYYLLGPMDHEV